jgi:RNA polymerase sigma factor (sigma-70 family)
MTTLGVADEAPAVPGADAAAGQAEGAWTGWVDLLGEQRDSLVRMAHLRLRRDVSGSDAEDVVHEVFLRVVGRGPDPREIDRPTAYLRRAVVNECVTRWRRHRELAVDDTPDRHEGDHADRCATGVAVRAALDLLTPRQRSVIVLGFLCGYADDEVAATLGIEPVTVRTLRARALRRMREAFEDPREPAEPGRPGAPREPGEPGEGPSGGPREAAPVVARRVILPTGPAPQRVVARVPGRVAADPPGVPAAGVGAAAVAPPRTPTSG